MKISLIASHIQDNYGITPDEITLHRDMIGYVFFFSQLHLRYVVKLYRPIYGLNALQTVQVLDYLKEYNFPVLEMYQAKNSEKVTYLAFEQKLYPCIVFQYIDGEEPHVQKEAAALGYQLGMLHKIMKDYPGNLIKRQKYEYLDEYIEYMTQQGLSTTMLNDLEQYGIELWERINHLPQYFCHGDFHTGNILRGKNHEYYFLDYDDMSGDWPIMDIAYLSDVTNFNTYNDVMFEAVEKQFERIYEGYGKMISIGQKEYHGIFDFVAVRHYQILARIIKCQGLECISMDTCLEQYDWLMKWNNLCRRKLSQ